VTFSGRLHAQPSIQTMTSAKTIVGSKALCYLLAQFKRHYNYPFSVTNKKTPGAKFFRRGHRIQGIRSIRFDCPSLDVPKLSGGKPALTGAFDVQSRNASKLDQKSVSARRPPGSAERQHPIIKSAPQCGPGASCPDHTACYA
jgi:hypothetical protein